MCKSGMKAYLKNHGWVAGMALLLDIIAFHYWRSFIETDSVHDGKHGITFFGEATYGHLAGASLGAAVLSFYFIKSVVQFRRGQ